MDAAKIEELVEQPQNETQQQEQPIIQLGRAQIVQLEISSDIPKRQVRLKIGDKTIMLYPKEGRELQHALRKELDRIASADHKAYKELRKANQDPTKLKVKVEIPGQ